MFGFKIGRGRAFGGRLCFYRSPSTAGPLEIAEVIR